MSSSVSISISIPTFNSIPNYLYLYLYLWLCIAPLFSQSADYSEATPVRKGGSAKLQLRPMKERCRHCGQSRHCDHMKEWRRIATATIP